jgi:hypothetical protein
VINKEITQFYWEKRKRPGRSPFFGTIIFIPIGSNSFALATSRLPQRCPAGARFLQMPPDQADPYGAVTIIAVLGGLPVRR